MDITKTVAIVYLCAFLLLFLFGRPLLRVLRRRWQLGGAQLLSLAKRAQDRTTPREAACDHGRLPEIVAACSCCKKLRGSDGRWYTWEEYLLQQGIQVSHGVCQDCGDELYPWRQQKKKAI